MVTPQLLAPRQARSRAALERMLNAAEQLMRDRGADDFTLAEVSRLGEVSFSSIYSRFQSKDALVRAIQERVIAELQPRQVDAFARASRQASSLPELVKALVEGLAEPMRVHAEILRPIMLRSITDSAVAVVGQRSYAAIVEAWTRALLVRADEITHPDHERAIAAVFNLAYSTTARFLGFGSPARQHPDIMAWHALKEDIALMGSSFLMVDARLARR